MATTKAATKTEILTAIANETELTRKQVAAVFESLGNQIKTAVGKKGPGLFTVPGLMKITLKHKPAKKAGMRMDPFTKQERMFPAKPASKAIRIRPLKAMREYVA